MNKGCFSVEAGRSREGGKEGENVLSRVDGPAYPRPSQAFASTK